MTHKKIMFVSRKAPYGRSAAAEMIEAVLVAAAFDQQVHLVFLDDGVFQLARAQTPEAIGHKPFAEHLSELGEYDIDHVWVERESLAERGLSEHDLMIAVSLLDRAAIAGKLAEADMLMSL
ncbi:MAG TPA: sulfurtransferase complex subunit TusC [Candidatus Sulfotelmatobacter sp.]|jgi:tRNA 2-thiouridine synthesizing protein C|nr:sulfurtransferase complex subunit TusC [Candidatus Sulfotelmatobacter sp.]